MSESHLHGSALFTIPLIRYYRCCLSTPPENIRKPLGFLMFLGGIDKQKRTVMS